MMDLVQYKLIIPAITEDVVRTAEEAEVDKMTIPDLTDETEIIEEDQEAEAVEITVIGS